MFVKSFQNATFKSLSFNPFFAKEYLNNSNQDPDVYFYNISSIETSYILPSEANDKLKYFSAKTFSILHLNIRSMTKNFETFQEYYNSLNVNFSKICLSETWTNDNNLGKNSFQLEGYKPVHQIRKIAREARYLYSFGIRFCKISRRCNYKLR